MTTTSKKATKGKKFAPIFVGTEPEMVELAKLQRNTWNPNELTADEKKALRSTLKTKGWARSQSMLVWATDEKGRKKNVIVDGEHRWEEARKLGYDKGPAVMLHRTSRADAVAWTLRIDKIRGRFNDRKVARVLDVEFGIFAGPEPKIDLGLDLGFSALELEGLRVKLPAKLDAAPANATKYADDEEIPEPPKKATTQVGDVWILGEHRLICGDCFDPAVRAKLFEKARTVDLVLSDPPYAIYGSSTGIGSDIADDKMVRPFFEAMFRAIWEHLKEFGHCYIHCDWRSWAAIWESSKRAQMTVKNCLVWDKGGSGLGSNYANTYENVAFLAKLPPATAMKSTERRGQRTINKPNVVRHNRPHGEERQHNAAKPVEMLRDLVRNSTEEGERVADFFGGSGSTLMACEREGRVCFVTELEPKWCDVIVNRWQKATGKKAQRIAAAA